MPILSPKHWFRRFIYRANPRCDWTIGDTFGSKRASSGYGRVWLAVAAIDHNGLSAIVVA